MSTYDPVLTCVRTGGPARPSEFQCVGVCVRVRAHVCVRGPGVMCLCLGLLLKHFYSLLPTQYSLPEGKCRSQKPSQVRPPGNVAFAQKAAQANMAKRKACERRGQNTTCEGEINESDYPPRVSGRIRLSQRSIQR